MSGWNLSKFQGGEEDRQTNSHGKSIPSRGNSYAKTLIQRGLVFLPYCGTVSEGIVVEDEVREAAGI